MSEIIYKDLYKFANRYSMKLLISITFLFFLICSILAPYSYAANSQMKLVDVGLSFGKELNTSAIITSDDGFTFGFYQGDNFLPLVNLSNYSKLTMVKDGYFDGSGSYSASPSYYSNGNIKGGYHLLFGEKYSSYDSASNAYIMYKAINKDVYIHFNNGWQLAIGNYITEADAVNDMNRLAQIIQTGSFSVLPPERGRIIVYGNDVPLISFDTSVNDYAFKTKVFEYNGTRYRNSFIIKRIDNSDYTVINRVTMSEYLYGVLPKEMNGEWPLEVLKAQAVAARNYVYTSSTKHRELGFDVCATTHCQVYGGYSVEKPRSNEAVDSTMDIGLFYNGELTACYYHANSGGTTDNAENVWSSSVPYIKGVVDPYSLEMPSSTWTLKLSISEIQAKLLSAGYNIGALKSVKISERTAFGRVAHIEFVGSNGSAILLKEKARAVFGYTALRSMNFSFNSEYTNIQYVKNSIPSQAVAVSRGADTGTVRVVAADGAKDVMASNLFAITSSGISNISGTNAYNGIRTQPFVSTNSNNKVDEIETESQTNVQVMESLTDFASGYITFYGRGYGHGLGMSQWGAKNMAEMGMDYRQILSHYYPGTYLDVIR